MAVSTILMSIQYLTARLLQNKKKVQHFASLLMNV